MAAARPAVVNPSAFGTCPTLTWQGEITATNTDEVWKATEEFFGSSTGEASELTIDLSQVSFIDSTAVGLMVRTKKHTITHGVQLHFVGVQPDVRNVIRLCQLEAFLLDRSS